MCEQCANRILRNVRADRLLNPDSYFAAEDGHLSRAQQYHSVGATRDNILGRLEFATNEQRAQGPNEARRLRGLYSAAQYAPAQPMVWTPSPAV
jgi:hypothetical protein